QIHKRSLFRPTITRDSLPAAPSTGKAKASWASFFSAFSSISPSSGESGSIKRAGVYGALTLAERRSQTVPQSPANRHYISSCKCPLFKSGKTPIQRIHGSTPGLHQAVVDASAPQTLN